MIEQMKVLHIVTTASQKQQMLTDVRELGVMHLAEKASADRELTERFQQLSKIQVMLRDYAPKKVQGKTLPDDEFQAMYSDVLAAMDRKSVLQQARGAAITEIERLNPWGEFIPSEVEMLRENGIDFHFYRLGKKESQMLADSKAVDYIVLKPVDKMNTVAVVGVLPKEIPASEFSMPAKGVPELRQVIADSDQGIEECNKILRNASQYDPAFQEQLLKAQNAEFFSAASRTAGGDDDLVWLSGYVPETELQKFRATAVEKGWAWGEADPEEEDDQVPTKVHYTKVTGLIEPLFNILGTIPGYREMDISLWFFGFFILFFAMIIGDAGYGFLFLAATIVYTIKTRKLNNVVLLVYVLSIATIVWGAVTGTWFGTESAMKIPLLKALVYPKFANYPEYFGIDSTVQQHAVMKFAFTIGMIHIGLACVLSILRKAKQKDLSLFSDLGWLIAVVALYFLVLYLVIGQAIAFAPVVAAIVVAFVLVVLFGQMTPDRTIAQGLKAGLQTASRYS